MATQSPPSRLTAFPAAEAGEALLGLMVRASARYPIDLGGLLNALIGQSRSSGALHPAVPTHTAHISAAMPLTHSLADHAVLLRDHTAAPYYLFFASAQRRAQALDQIGASRTNVACSLGVTTARLQLSPHPRSCSACNERAESSTGIGTYRLEHQLPTTWLCQEHEVLLTDGCPSCGRFPLRWRALDRPGRCADPAHRTRTPCIELSEDERRDAIWLAQQGAALLRCYDEAPTDPLGELRRAAVSRFPTPRGLDALALARAIELRFDAGILRHLGLSFTSEHDRSRGWHSRLLSNTTRDRLKEPAQCLVVLGTLFDGVEAFLQGVAQRSTAAPAPLTRLRWTEELPRLLVESKGALAPVQAQCGVTFGVLWREMLRQGLTVPMPSKLPLNDSAYRQLLDQWEAGTDQTEMMKNFGVSEHFLKMVVLWEPGLMHRWRAARLIACLETHKQTLEQYISAHPYSGRQQVRKAEPGAFESIFKSDRAWIEHHFPKRQGNFRAQKDRPRLRKNWQQRDLELSAQIREWTEVHLRSTEKPVRLTTRYLLRKFGAFGRYLTSHEQLPATTEALAACTETLQVYRCRRVRWAARRIAEHRLPLKAEAVRLEGAIERRYVVEFWQDVVEAYLAAGGSVTGPLPQPGRRVRGEAGEAPRRRRRSHKESEKSNAEKKATSVEPT